MYEVSATSWSLVQRIPTDCGASLCVIRNLKHEEPMARAMARVGAQRHRNKNNLVKSLKHEIYLNSK